MFDLPHPWSYNLYFLHLMVIDRLRKGKPDERFQPMVIDIENILFYHLICLPSLVLDLKGSFCWNFFGFLQCKAIANVSWTED